MNRIVFVLGANIGNRQKNINDAIFDLEKNLELVSTKKSFFMKNSAILPKGAPQGWNREFLNLAFSGDVDLDRLPPLKILEIIKNIEKKIGRIDRGRWSPREIDIDIALIKDISLEIERLCIPHKSLTSRSFFIKPILDIERKLLLNIFPNLDLKY
jgi:2-amino-4-hydroxy-6-hydroxymethyldihydropteridine diphosphokinase